ncbi:Ubiquitin carboxyl-terminal hydrolase isozyme L3 [Galdieria sulphuraria]|uniref:Ubiquitin carboxyl-terminal hydrolase n=1 Tax=Galdieria sulphuraria TaxID=130081 RepID=M2XSE2_GALSU|nr:ubiquitin carboxyl-terminal hydrolase L3 [Galdieria sulphuraria]EME26593.1 ubiquitin carboxyl-terminal hydrolase L3 [Galdieria sulphuraria]GJD07399.1 Ubiquitin carboxyl-terminal hydrolase isozyme L3 [Galdieria sulphuraria]|eukprot:XP_005703113.1 ubiquitin carboxyl-terminal hydrolase L3 [Galdieria sulphuraria]
MTENKANSKRWIPLESNPQVLSEYLHKLGVEENVSLVDVLSPDLLDLVPRPVYAVILLYPLHNQQSTREEIKQETSVYFCKQTISNACGTVALVHAVLNNIHRISCKKNSFFDKFYTSTVHLSPHERATCLEQSEELDYLHSEFAQVGQSQAPGNTEEIDLHFVTFVSQQGKLIQLDGRLEQPVVCGNCEEENLLQEATNVIKEQFMAKDPNEVRFNILALVHNES